MSLCIYSRISVVLFSLISFINFISKPWQGSSFWSFKAQCHSSFQVVCRCCLSAPITEILQRNTCLYCQPPCPPVIRDYKQLMSDLFFQAATAWHFVSWFVVTFTILIQSLHFLMSICGLSSLYDLFKLAFQCSHYLKFYLFLIVVYFFYFKILLWVHNQNTASYPNNRRFPKQPS